VLRGRKYISTNILYHGKRMYTSYQEVPNYGCPPTPTPTPCCPKNRAARGPPGPPGDPGATGPPGPAGQGTFTPQFISLVAQQQQDGAMANVLFQPPVTQSGGFTYSNATGVLTFNVAGTYDIRYCVTSPQVAQFALYLNGVIVPNSTITTTPNIPTCNEVILTVAAGDTLSLRNLDAGSVIVTSATLTAIKIA
jgi:hypothetical protein